jgi:putative nucleotidyltransferase with HDIG domain
LCVFKWLKDAQVKLGQAKSTTENGKIMNVNLDQVKEQTKLGKNLGTDIELKEYETRLEFLYDIAQQASSAAEISDLLKEIPGMIQQILNASASSLLLIDEEEKQFCLRASCSEHSKMLEQTKLSLDSGIAGFVALNSQPVIVNDVSLDEAYNKNIDTVSGLDIRSIIAAPLVRGSKVIGVLEMMNKKNGNPFNDGDLGLLTYFTSTEAFILLVSMATILINNFKLCQKIQSEYKSAVETLVSYADVKDPYAHGHSRRVKEYSILAANAFNLSPEELRLIEFGALLHDIGKIGIDDRILRKTEGLSTEEWYIIRKHALKGANIVRLIPNLEKITDIILYHHERYDGTGYPEGLKGEKIPLGARIIAVADAFDTMTTDRAYRSAMSFDKAIRELLKHRGKQFCPQVVEAFVTQLRKQKEVSAIKEDRSAVENLLIQEIEKAAKQEDIAVSREEKPAPGEVVVQEIEKDTKQEDIAVSREEKPAPGEVVVQEIEKDTKQETISVNAEDNPADEMILMPVVEEATKQEAAMENKECNPEAEAILKRFAEEATKRGGLVESLVDKSAGEIGKGKTPGSWKRKKNQGLTEKVAKQDAKEKGKKKAKTARKAKVATIRNHDINAALFEGDVQLAIVPVISFRKMYQFKKCLLMVEGVKIVSESWSEDEGFILSILLQTPMNLGSVLQRMTDVQEVYQEGPRVVVVLRTCDEEKTNEPAISVTS